MKTKALLLLLGTFGVAVGTAHAAVTWYAVDPMSERQFLPDAPPVGGLEGEPVRIVSAQGEYEPGSFVVTADADLGKVDFAVGPLKGEGGATIPASSIDLKTVKVWYQAGTAWFSYFQDTGLKLCPELLLHDEDLVKVDEEKVANYARLDDGDGKYHYHWLTTPRGIDPKGDDAFREAIDDIRYATLLQQLARPLVGSPDVPKRYAARKALQCLSDLDGDDYDLGATRLEIVRHILALRECGAQPVASGE